MEGLKNYGRYFDLEFDDIFKVKIDLNKANRNEYVLMNLFNTGGSINPLSCGLIYSNKSSQSNVDFGNKIKLNSYMKLKSSSSTSFTLINADDSEDVYTYDTALSKYINKEKQLVATAIKDEYSEITDLAITSKDGTELDLKVDKNYPTLISNDYFSTTFNLDNGLTSISNGVNDVINFSVSSNTNKTITWKKSNNTLRLITLTYDSNNNLTGLVVKNINGQTLRSYTLTMTSNNIKIVNTLSNKQLEIIIASNTTTVKTGYTNSYVNLNTNTITYGETLTKVTDCYGLITKYIYDYNNKITSVISSSNYGIVSKYNGHKLIKESKPLNILETNFSLLNNGYFTNGTTSWSTDSTCSVITNTNSDFSFVSKMLNIKMGKSAEQTITLEGTTLDQYTLSFVHGLFTSNSYYHFTVYISSYDSNNVLLEEKSVIFNDFLGKTGLTFDAISFAPTKKFSKLKVKVYSSGIEVNIGCFSLTKQKAIMEFKYNDKDALISMLAGKKEIRINTDDKGKLTTGNIDEYIYDISDTSTKQTSLYDYGVKVEIGKDSYQREVSKKITAQNDTYLETKTYTGDYLTSESDSFVDVNYAYSNNEKLLQSYTNEEDVTTTYEYSNNSTLKKMSQGSSNISYTFSNEDDLLTYNNYENVITQGKLSEVKMNGDRLVAFSYDSSYPLSVKEKLYPDSKVVYTYDNKRRISNVKIDDTSDKTYTYVYNTNDQVTSVSDGTNITSFEYDVDGNVIKETRGTSFVENSIDLNGELLSTRGKIDTNVVLSSFDQQSKKTGKSYSSFKNMMYRKPSFLSDGSVSYDTYCCFFDKDNLGLININSKSNDQEAITVIEPTSNTLTITRHSDDYNIVNINASTTGLLVYNLPTINRSKLIDCQVMFDFKKYSAYDSGVVMYLGQKTSKAGSLMLKCVNESDGQYLALYKNNGSDSLIDSNLKIKIEDDGWNKVGIAIKQYQSGSSVLCNLILYVNGTVKSKSSANISTELKFLNNASHICFGGCKINSSVSEALYSSVSSIMITMNKNTPQAFNTNEFSEIWSLNEKYREYDSRIYGQGYVQTGVSQYKLTSSNSNKHDIFPLNGTFNSLIGTKPYSFEALSKVNCEEKYFFTFKKTARRYEYEANGEYLVYKTIGSSGTVSINTKILTSNARKNVFALKVGTRIFDLYYENRVLKFKDSSTGTITSCGDLTEGESRITLVWAPSSNNTLFRVFINSNSPKSITISTFSLSTNYLLLGRDYEANYPLNSTMNDLVISNYSIGTSISTITNIIKKIRVNHLLNRYGGLYREEIHNLSGTNVLSKQYGYQTYNGKRTNYLSNETITLGDGSENVFEYKYTDLNDNPTSLIQKLTYTNGNQVIPVEYFYDANNRLIREVNTGNVTNYAYDNYGNITSRGGKTVDYDDKNRIISYDGKTFKYASNNPYKLLSYGTYNGTTQLTGLSFTYLGRNISSITDHNINTTYSFTYDHQGRRITKQVNNDSVIQYVYLNNRLEAEIRSSYTLRFLYDEHNNLYGFYYNDIPYFYLRNALGTIYGIIDQTGKKVVEYTYDAWGKLLTTTRSNDTNNIASINPFIYKAYYYDVETQLFYCNSRYYSPELCRWISPDSIEYLEPQSINGLNLYCYCYNNPISYYDPSGHSALLIGLLIFTGAMTLGGAIYGGVSAGMAGGDVGDVFAGIGKGVFNGLILGGGISLAIGGFVIGGTSILGSIMATYGLSISANMLEVAITQGKKSNYDGDSFWAGANDINNAMFANLGNILIGKPTLMSIPFYGTRMTSKIPTIFNVLVSYDIDNFFGSTTFLSSAKSTLLGKASPLGLAVGYGLTAWQYYKLFRSIFTTPDFENSRWILY